MIHFDKRMDVATLVDDLDDLSGYFANVPGPRGHEATYARLRRVLGLAIERLEYLERIAKNNPSIFGQDLSPTTTDGHENP